MTQANNNEVDLLLRSLARQRGASAVSNSSAAGNGGGLSDHLDADELNSYAEGVLPAAARTRYTEHLADCDDCRGLIVSLSQAAGGVSRPPHTENVGSTFWQKLAKLFSLPVIRIAIPALMLTVVIGIGLMAFWRGTSRDVVVQNEQLKSSTPSVAFDSNTAQRNAEAPAASHPATTSASPVDLKAGGGRGAGLNEQEKTRDADEGLIASETGAAKAPASVLKDGAPKEVARDSAGAYATEPKPAAAPPPPADTRGQLSKSDDYDRAERPAKREDQNRQYQYKSTPEDERGGPSRATQANNVTVQGAQNQVQNIEGGARSRGPSGSDKNKKVTEIDSRTVAGRRFVRDGNAWIDTAYDSSKNAIRVSRGSEQFRALVADEPAIQTIADQLDGVVIVVWKNRTYRIQ